jgi:ABC-type Fe3+ transport system permease subunit
MTPAAIAIVIIFLIAGLTLGWHSQKSYAAHGDIKVGKSRVRGGRRTRWRSGLWTLLILVVLVIAVKDVVFGH